MTQQELKDEMRYDMLQEAREEAYNETRLHEDEEYAIEAFVYDNICLVEANAVLSNEIRKTITNLAEYGYEFSVKDIKDMLCGLRD